MTTLMRPPSPTRRCGFTLIELIVVMVLIALLLTIAVPRYFRTIDAGKVKVQRQNLSVLRDAIDKYYGDRGRYPDTLDDLVQRRYLREVPLDPVSETTQWTTVAPSNGEAGGIFDVSAPVMATDQPTAEPK